jgi:thiol-disulfide isomerase/thioredoxin
MFMLVLPAAARAQAAAPAAPSPAPPSPVSGIRGKLAAADLPSAESILEVHREKHGEDGPWLAGLSWLARGALMLGERDKAARFAALARARCADSVAMDPGLTQRPNAETALGASLEVQAQLLARSRGTRAATAFLRDELSRIPGPVALRSRLYKRINLLELTGRPAPEIVPDDVIGPGTVSLAALRGRPVVLFLWAEWCGDCKAQAASLARVRAKFESRGLQVVALTRWYDDVGARVRERARVDSVWKAVYPGMGETPVVFGTDSMERYGGSATPTFVFVDRAGIVRGYTATRLTEEALERAVAAIAD